MLGSQGDLGATGSIETPVAKTHMLEEVIMMDLITHLN